MALRHAILGLLARKPSTGYELTQMFDLSLRTVWYARHSQIYPELARLEAAGLVEVVAHGARGSKSYALTEDGRAELHEWLMDDDPDRSQRNESGVRLFLGQLLTGADKRQVFERDLAHVEAESAHLQALREKAGPTDPFRAQIDLGLRMNAVLIEWLREQVDAASDGDTASDGDAASDRDTDA